MRSEYCIAKLEETNCLDDCDWFRSELFLDGVKLESLFIFDKNFPDSQLAESLLDIAEEILGKEKFHDLLMNCL